MRSPYQNIFRQGKPKTCKKSRQNHKNFIMKKFLLPAFVILMGTGAAFVTQSFKTADKAIVDGYRIDESDPENPTCVNMHVECSNAPTAFLCEDVVGNQLFELQGTSCPEELFKP